MNFGRVLDLAARNDPGATAVGDEERELTFGGLRAEANAFANAIEALGVEADDPVAIYAENSVTFVAAYFGIMRRGAVPFLVNRRFSERELAHVFDDAGAVAVVTTATHAAEIPALDTDRLEHVVVDGDTDVGRSYAELVSGGAETYTPAPRQDDDLTELLYTSGTTGLPKGVKHTHGNVRASAEAVAEYRHLDRHDVALTVTPCFHVSGLFLTVTPAASVGAENRLLAGWDPEAALAAVEAHDVTYTFMVPSQLIDLLNFEGRAAYDTGSLSVVGTGGAPVPRARAERFEETFGCRVVEGYGLTETGLTVTTPLDLPRKFGSTGLPGEMDMADTRIVDPETGEPVDTGERGEILQAGDVVAPGYIGLPEKTAESFVEFDGQRWLRTGDVGRIDADGYLFVEDRLDDMILTGGENVYPNEVEDVCYEIEGVAEAAVVGLPDERWGERVTAIVVPSDEGATVEDVVDGCRAKLADYKVPRRVEFVAELPTTSTLKVDKKRLRERFANGS
jgi:long-chain acyl-CoA synthetase